MINQKKLRVKAFSKLGRKKKDIADAIPMDNGNFSRWLSGLDVGEKTADKIRLALNGMK